MLKPGDIINATYRVEKLLGSGGMADVYIVTHLRMPRKFALKVMRIQTAVRHDFLERFNRECEILATLKHPHIVDIMDRHQLPSGDPYLVMELLEGEDLATYIARTGALPVPVALRICNQIAEALDAAHKVGIVHRDLKPSNIFLSREGQLLNFVKVLDFGIAKISTSDKTPMTAPAALMGTPGYMAPEQARGDNASVGPATDQFALAAIVYEMISGRPAFYSPEDSVYAILARVIETEPSPLPHPQINLAVMRALSKEPGKRFPSLREFVAAVGATTHTIYGNASSLVPTTPGTLSHGEGHRRYVDHKLRVRRWLPALLLGVMVTGVIGIGGYRKLRSSAAPRGQCTVLIEPAGAHVWVDDAVRPIGQTRTRHESMTIELGVGAHRFALSRSPDGSKRSSDVIGTVVNGASCSVTLKDFPADDLPMPSSTEVAIDAGASAQSVVRFRCQVLVEPAGVELWVDQTAIGITRSRSELLTVELGFGQHVFLLRNPKDGASRSDEVTVSVTDTEPCSLTLKSLPSAVLPVVGNGIPKTQGSRPGKAGSTRFQITTKPKLHVVEMALGVCAGEHLAPLALSDGTIIKLERSGTLAIADGPPAVLRTGFNLCARQALARVSHDLIPESATIKIIREQ